MSFGSAQTKQAFLRRLITDRNNAISKKLKEQFPDLEEAWAIEHLLQSSYLYYTTLQQQYKLITISQASFQQEAEITQYH